MRIISFFLLTIICACSSKNTEPSSAITTEEQQIAKSLIQGAFDDLWAGLDSTKVLKYHTEDFVILENGEVWTNKEVKSYMRETSKNSNRPFRTNRMEYHSFDKYGSSITVAYDNFATFSQADSIVGKGHWLESALIVKEGEDWRIKLMHSTWIGSD